MVDVPRSDHLQRRPSVSHAQELATYAEVWEDEVEDWPAAVSDDGVGDPTAGGSSGGSQATYIGYMDRHAAILLNLK